MSSALAWRIGRVERRCGLEGSGKERALTRIEKTERHPKRDIRLRKRIEALEALPEPQRNHLVEFLDALISAHTALRRYERQGR
jgi:hypothetical protein